MTEEGKKLKRSALDAAADILSYRMRTAAELAAKLKEKGYESDEIESAVKQMKSLRYIDDYAYALRYFEYGFEKKRGYRRLVRELTEKGVSASDIELAYEDFCYENKVDEYEAALELARTEFDRASASIELDKLIARVARKLESRGYRTDDIYKIMAEMRRWRDSEEQSI